MSARARPRLSKYFVYTYARNAEPEDKTTVIT